MKTNNQSLRVNVTRFKSSFKSSGGIELATDEDIPLNLLYFKRFVCAYYQKVIFIYYQIVIT